jgi:hypothetical protein
MKTLNPSSDVSAPSASLVPEEQFPEEQLLLRRGDNAAARALLAEWMADESGYDERVWPEVKRLIEENRLSDRKRFAE